MKSLKFLIILLVLGAGAFVAWSWWSKKSPDQMDFHTIQVARGNLEIRVLATGIVQPENRLELKPPISGRVESIEVDEGQRVHKGQVLAWLSSSDRAALLDAARAKGPAELAHWEEFFKPTPLLAPLDGLIIVKSVVPGQVVASTDVVLVMSDHLIVNTQVDETDIGKIQLGQKVQITLDAYPKQEIPGKVTRLAFESRTVNNVTIYDVEALPDQVPEFMRSGMTANVKFFVKTRDNVLIIPTEAIHQEKGRSFVKIPSPNTSRPPINQDVQLGLSDGKSTEVISGLSEEQTILIPNLAKIRTKATGGSNPFSPFGGGGQRPRP